MLNITKRQILPVAARYSGRLGRTVRDVVGANVSADTQTRMLKKVCSLIDTMSRNIEILENNIAEATGIKDAYTKAKTCHDKVISAMKALRQTVDQMETIVDADIWPLPTYAEMLFLR